MKTDVLKQKVHYETIHDEYQAHYFDAESMSFRDRFVYNPMFSGIDLTGKDVADLAAGSGYNSVWVSEHFPSARLCGFDISEKACEAYRRNTGFEAHAFDLTSGEAFGRKFDVAMVFGGLHHCVTDLPKTFETIQQLLRPGGLLLMYEPSSRFLLEGVRKLWYRLDPTFDAGTEAALDPDTLVKIAGPAFEPVDRTFMGGPAYFLIYNSMIFRLPRSMKPYLARSLFPMEAIYNKFPVPAFFPYFIARWRKSGAQPGSREAA
jgi:SAM-dependent methyltransferase